MGIKRSKRLVDKAHQISLNAYLFSGARKKIWKGRVTQYLEFVIDVSTNLFMLKLHSTQNLFAFDI